LLRYLLSLVQLVGTYLNGDWHLKFSTIFRAYYVFI
jgi:hypothetical protein